MGYKTSGNRRIQASSAVSSSVLAYNNSDGTGFAVAGTAITAATQIKQIAVTPGQSVAASTTVLGGATITSVAICDATYAVLSGDTAISTSGGYIKITGTGFITGCTVYVNGIAATTTTFVSSTEVRAAVQAYTAGTYSLTLFNASGSGAIYSAGVVYSGFPTFTTGSYSNVTAIVSTQLLATGDGTLTYSLQGGSTLPSGVSLSSTGLLSGTITGLSVDTIYTFTVLVDDSQYQTTQQLITLTVLLSDQYFKNTVLLLHGNSGSATTSTNNTFLDSSTNNYTITRTGTPTQGTFTPFSQTGWSGSFAANEKLSSPSIGTSIGTGDFSIECWAYVPSGAANYSAMVQLNTSSAFDLYLQISANTLRILDYNGNTTGSYFILSGGTINNNTWYHILLTRQSGTVRGFINGNLIVNQTGITFNYGTAAAGIINAGLIVSNISNARVVLGNVPTAYQTSSTTNGTQIFTPSTTPLTAVSGTVLLTCQSNRFVDNSSTPQTITITGTPSIRAFSPFAPTAAYSTSTVGGSMYFNGTSDWITKSGAADTLPGDFTVECWIYFNSTADSQTVLTT